MKLISYSLFEPKKFYDHRFWDDDRMEPKRYWYNIPALLLINGILYPDYKTIIYMDDQTFESDLSHLLSNLLGDFSFQMRRVSEDYQAHEPSMWRLKPLWEEDVDIFMSRDIDSVPNIDEYRSLRVFESSDKVVHTIRSHPNHYGHPCRMLIGLSSFKPKQIGEEVKMGSYKSFKERYSDREKWDNDQCTLINCFTCDEDFTKKNFLDSRINAQGMSQDFPCASVPLEYLNNVLFNKSQLELLSLIQEYGLAEWAGQPCDARKDFLEELYNLFGMEKVLEKIKQSKLGEFYL